MHLTLCCTVTKIRLHDFSFYLIHDDGEHRNVEINGVIWFKKLKLKSEMIMCPVFRQQQQKILQMGIHIKDRIHDDKKNNLAKKKGEM